MADCSRSKASFKSYPPFPFIELLSYNNVYARISTIYFKSGFRSQNTWQEQEEVLKLARRGLGGTINNNRRFTPRETFVLQLAGCIPAGISVFAGLLTLFWFYRINKEFRHR